VHNNPPLSGSRRVAGRTPSPIILWLALFCGLLGGVASAADLHPATKSLLAGLKSPILLHGNDRIAYRDPLLFYQGDTFHLFFSYVREEEDRLIYWYVATSESKDLVHWTEPRTLTPKGQDLNYASPGNIVRVGDQWLMGVQTYPIVNFRRGDPLRFNDDRARLFLLHSRDFVTWSNPELIKVKGPDVGEAELGRMIDPFLLRDKDVPGKWWCFWKQAGSIHCSWSYDLRTWTVGTRTIAFGENAQVIVVDGEYVMFYAPANGVGVKRSSDLVHWREEEPPIVLGQKDWPWCETRLTGGYVADLRDVPGVGKYVMVCHSMGPGKKRTDANVNANCHILIAWSDDLKTWEWPGKQATSAAPAFCRKDSRFGLRRRV